MRSDKNAIIRQNKIRDLLISQGTVKLNELCEAFSCSEATIRNDLTKLEKQKVLKRVLGGAVATENTPRNSNIAKRLALKQSEKLKIAEYVAKEVIKPNMIISLDSGTTTMMIAQKILDYKIPCTVLTNSFLAATILTKAPDVELHLAGGCFDPDHASFHDDVSTMILKTMQSEICIISPNGINSSGIVTNSGLEENVIKHQMIQQASRTVLVADHSKIGVTELKILCHAKDVSLIVTDDNAAAEQIQMLHDAGFTVAKAE